MFRPGRVMKQHKVHGHFQVELSKDQKARKFFVHRLVYMTFCGEIVEGKEINHINGYKACNAPWNLECITRQEHWQRTKDLNQVPRGDNYWTKNRRRAKREFKRNHPAKKDPEKYRQLCLKNCAKPILSEDDVREIRRELRKHRKRGKVTLNERYETLAEKYGVRPSTIKAIKYRANWKYIR